MTRGMEGRWFSCLLCEQTRGWCLTQTWKQGLREGTIANNVDMCQLGRSGLLEGVPVHMLRGGTLQHHRLTDMFLC